MPDLEAAYRDVIESFKFDGVEGFMTVFRRHRLEPGFDCLGKDKSLMWLAIEHGRLDICQKLIEVDTAFSRERDSYGRTNLMRAAMFRSDQHMQQKGWLALFKCDINRQDRGGYTALMYACEGTSTHRGNEGLVRTLLEFGADPSIKNAEGKTALGIANRVNIARSEDVDRKIQILLDKEGGKDSRSIRFHKQRLRRGIRKTNQKIVALLEQAMINQVAVELFTRKYECNFDHNGHLQYREKNH